MLDKNALTRYTLSMVNGNQEQIMWVPDQLNVIVGKPLSRGDLIAKIFRLRNRLGEPNPDYIPDGYYDVPIDDLIRECNELQRRVDAVDENRWIDSKQP